MAIGKRSPSPKQLAARAKFIAMVKAKSKARKAAKSRGEIAPAKKAARTRKRRARAFAEKIEDAVKAVEKLAPEVVKPKRRKSAAPRRKATPRRLSSDSLGSWESKRSIPASSTFGRRVGASFL